MNAVFCSPPFIWSMYGITWKRCYSKLMSACWSWSYGWSKNTPPGALVGITVWWDSVWKYHYWYQHYCCCHCELLLPWSLVGDKGCYYHGGVDDGIGNENYGWQCCGSIPKGSNHGDIWCTKYIIFCSQQLWSQGVQSSILGIGVNDLLHLK